MEFPSSFRVLREQIMAPQPHCSDLGLPPALSPPFRPRLSGPSLMRWDLGQLEDAPSLGFSKHFLEHPCATPRDPPYPPTLLGPCPDCVCVWRGGSSWAWPWAGTTSAGTGLPKEGSVSGAFVDGSLEGIRGWKAGVHELRLDGAVGVRALLRTLRSLCKLSSHYRPSMGGSLSRSVRCSFINLSHGGALHRSRATVLAPLPVSLEFPA